MTRPHDRRRLVDRLRETPPIRRVLSGLLVLASAVLVAGIVTEHVSDRGAVGVAPQPGQSEQREATGHPEASGEEGGEARAPQGEAPRGETETVLGIPAESPPVVALAVLASGGAAALVLVSRRRAVIVGAGALAAVFVTVDCAELLAKAGEARPTLAVLAGLTKALHIGVALTAGAVLLRGRPWRHNAPG